MGFCRSRFAFQISCNANLFTFQRRLLMDIAFVYKSFVFHNKKMIWSR